MPVIAYRGESSLAEILDRVYLSLEPAEREIAAAAVLRSNPQLRDPRSVRPGAALVVPDVPSLAGKTRRDPSEPHAALASILADVVTSHAASIEERVQAEREGVTGQTKLLRSAAFKRSIADEPSLQAMAEEAEAALGQRGKRLAEDREFGDAALRELLADLERMGR